MTYTDEQKKWCKEYQELTGFEPLMGDFEVGNTSFNDAAKLSVDWFEDWSTDILLRIPQIPEEG